MWVWVLPRSMASSIGRRLSLLDPLSPEPRERVAEACAIRQRQSRIELEKGFEDEAAVEDVAVRQRQALGAVLEVAQQQEVHVDGPRSVAHAAGRTAELALDGLALAEQPPGAAIGLHLQARV